MKPILKKHWTSMLGALFVVAAFITLFQYSVEQGWISDIMKIGIGLLAGLGFCIGGFKLTQRSSLALTGEIVMGIGACVLYATLTFAGIFYALWDPLVVLLGMIAVTIAMTVFSYRKQSRILMNISVAGGLLAPLLLRSESDQVFTLFLYLLVLNVAYFYLSVVKSWNELRLVSFIGTWLLYIVYFVHFLPSTEGLWNMPIRYAIAAYLFFTIGFLATSWKNKLSFAGMDLYLNASNGVLFGIWAFIIWSGEVDYFIVLAAMGILYTAAGYVVYRLDGKMSVSANTFTLAGVLLLLMALGSAGEGALFKVLLAIGIVYLLTALGFTRNWTIAKAFAVALWLYVCIIWYSITWWTPRGEWFGVYIPFLNWGAFAWMTLAGLGFFYTRKLRFSSLSDYSNRILSRVYALISHLIVGGLLARQIQNVFTEYFPSQPSAYMQLTLSVVWACYAVVLIMWGAYYKERLFRWFGSALLVIVAIKAIFMDLNGYDALFKMGVLLVLGALSFLITWINGKWSSEDAKEA